MVGRTTKDTHDPEKQIHIFYHPFSHNKTPSDCIVDFDGPNDPYNPLNWPFRKKCMTTILYGLTTMGASLSSSIYSPIVTTVANSYSVSDEVSLAGISLTLVGFGLGPLFWGPISEIYGRKPAIILPYLLGAIFAFACGASKDIQSILITRFFSGLFSSAPIVNVGGVMADIWKPADRATATVFYALAVIGGPLFGPIIGAAFIVSDVGWRWTQFFAGIFMIVVWALDAIVIDESYAPALLAYKAKRLRLQGNWALHARHEEWDPAATELLTKFGIRPLEMLVTPVCFLMALYGSFCYGLLYGNLAAFPIIFGNMGLSPLIGTLPFLGIFVGTLIAAGINILNQRFYMKAYKAAGKPVPEARLPPMMIGGVFFAIGCFLLAWTALPSHSLAGPLIASGMLGIGFVTIFLAALNYLIDTFRIYAASAFAANTFLRSSFAIAFPLFIGPMYARLGVQWGTSLFGFFALSLVPIPFLFYRYGAAIRHRGKYSRFP